MMLKSDIRTNYALYKNSQPLFKKWIKEKHRKITTDKYSEFILDNLPQGRSLWIDSFGYCFKSYNPNIYSIELKMRECFLKNLPDILCEDGFYKIMDMHINYAKTLNPTSLVLYDSGLLKYYNIDEYIAFFKNMQNIYKIPIFIKLNLLFADFNRLKYNYNDIGNMMESTIPSSIIPFKINNLNKTGLHYWKP